jgi:hypothetical protein
MMKLFKGICSDVVVALLCRVTVSGPVARPIISTFVRVATRTSTSIASYIWLDYVSMMIAS